MKKIEGNLYELTDDEVKILQPKPRAWKPEDNEEYYVDWFGDVVSTYWDGGAIDQWNLSQGNVFRTEAEAQAHRDYLAALGRVRLYILEHWPFAPDWSDDDQGKYFIIYDHYNGWLQGEYWYRKQYFNLLPYLPSVEAKDDVIANCEADLLTIFGVKK